MTIPVFSLDQIINQLWTSWSFPYHGAYTWNSTEVTYSFTVHPEYPQGMTDSQQAFAREAFEMWDDLIAINLTEVPPAQGNISFYYLHGDPANAGATETKWWPFDHTLSKAYVMINGDESSNDSAHIYYGNYGFLTYLHEIGHSLGLSHPGHYNGSADYLPDGGRAVALNYAVERCARRMLRPARVVRLDVPEITDDLRRISRVERFPPHVLENVRLVRRVVNR